MRGWIKYFCFLFVAACVPSQESSILFLGNGADPKTLDPHLSTGIPEYRILMALFEGLVQLDPKTTEPIPAVAKSWVIRKQGREYLFFLRNDARWSDGRSVVAGDFVAGVRRLLSAKTAAEYAYQAFYIKNGTAFHSGAIQDPTLLGIESLNAHTLRIELEAVTPFFLKLLAHHVFYPVREDLIRKHPKEWTQPEYLISNGPFLLESLKHNEYVRVGKNPLYWNHREIFLEGIEFYPIESRNVEEKLFRAGKLHLTDRVPPERIEYWQAKESVYVANPIHGIYFYAFNVTKPPFNDRRVREAFSLAVDREQLVRHVLRAGQTPAHAFVPQGCGGFSPKGWCAKTANRREARELLAQAGYREGRGFPRVTLSFNTNEELKKTAEAVSQMWKNHLSIEVSLQNQEWKTFLEARKRLDFSIASYTWIGDFDDPLTFFELLVPGGGNNVTGWVNQKYQELLLLGLRSQDLKKRYQYFQEIEQIIAAEMPVLPLYTLSAIHLKSPKLLGWYPNSMDYHPYSGMRLEP